MFASSSPEQDQKCTRSMKRIIAPWPPEQEGNPGLNPTDKNKAWFVGMSHYSEHAATTGRQRNRQEQPPPTPSSFSVQGGRKESFSVRAMVPEETRTGTHVNIIVGVVPCGRRRLFIPLMVGLGPKRGGELAGRRREMDLPPTKMNGKKWRFFPTE